MRRALPYRLIKIDSSNTSEGFSRRFVGLRSIETDHVGIGAVRYEIGSKKTRDEKVPSCLFNEIGFEDDFILAQFVELDSTGIAFTIAVDNGQAGRAIPHHMIDIHVRASETRKKCFC